MRDSLKSKCDLLLNNEAAVRKVAKLDWEHMVKLSALIFASRNKTADAVKMKECKQLLKQRAGAFSNWRGTMGTVVLTRMALADDPSAYLDGVFSAYEKIVAGKVYHSEYQAMTAMFLYELCEPDQLDSAIDQTLEQLDLMSKLHPLITTYSMMPLIGLMVFSGQDVEEMAMRSEECLSLIKPLFKLFPETKQSIAHVLAYSDKPAQEKVDYFWSLYQKLVASKHAMDLSHMSTILATFVDLTVPQDQLVAEIGEVELYLKGHTGYGALSVGKGFRCMIAAILVLADHEKDFGLERASDTSTVVAEAVVEQIINAIILIIVTSSAAAASSSSH